MSEIFAFLKGFAAVTAILALIVIVLPWSAILAEKYFAWVRKVIDK